MKIYKNKKKNNRRTRPTYSETDGVLIAHHKGGDVPIVPLAEKLAIDSKTEMVTNAMGNLVEQHAFQPKMSSNRMMMRIYGRQLRANKKSTGIGHVGRARKVDPQPTHTELRRMTRIAKLHGDANAIASIMAYMNKKMGWKEAYESMKSEGFTAFGYRRGFVQV